MNTGPTDSNRFQFSSVEFRCLGCEKQKQEKKKKKMGGLG